MTAKSGGTKRGSGRPPTGTTSVRDALLRSGATHFSQYGYAGASTRSILADAEATAPALYHHFGNKTGLYIAVAATGQEHVLDTLTSAIADKVTIADRVAALLEAATQLRREHPNIAKYLNVIQQDVARHPDLDELLIYQTRFDSLWQHVTDDVAPIPGLALGLRAVVEGLLAVGGAHVQPDEITSAAEALQQITHGGLEALQGSGPSAIE
ncbi:TetR/AcrR family transcriptional regulator [Mycobacterium vicinigordonae]|uniref:TetR/AcrR family transcriptional regulator n=1 Tax=Mycobacterium vicinigordonae TaxID=1719132 RepID=A0A7D6IBT6_9MYCO|nr:TetR/AcrR family transcriptional regulator [Mycobacterium vicinigordonae]QLL09797.1 TetR/AcrR family transcriptional regulator [Mycobacterium vicinigordonae]